MFNNFKHILIGILSAIIVVALGATVYNAFAASNGVSLSTASSNQNAGVNSGWGNGNGNQQSAQGAQPGAGDPAASLQSIPASALSSEESAALLYMREEEKLARDVYNVLGAAWNLPTFSNIAASEQMHMDEIKLLLDRYNLSDPAGAPGLFSDEKLQALYNSLIAQGSLSAGEALKVGAAIEEIDILDLQTRLAQSDNADIQQVFGNLESGSENHLRAFSSALQNQTGEIYAPQYLSAEMYAAMTSNTNGNGQNGGGNNGQGGYGQQNGSGVPQASANLSAATTVHGIVASYSYGTLTVTLDDGQTIGVQTGNQNFAQSIGFAPSAGQGITLQIFPGEQSGLYSAISATLDDSGQTFTFRESSGQPAWAGGKGKGGGNH
ncbi:MAG: hypothetical protein Fur0035_14010 [Anaerolineales bacterium]